MTPAEAATTAIAGAAVTSPLWLTVVHEMSQIAGMALPILGCIYLIVQIVGYVRKHMK